MKRISTTKKPAQIDDDDAAIIGYFKTMAGDRGYQTLINETLKKAMSGQALTSELRMVVREELVAHKIR